MAYIAEFVAGRSPADLYESYLSEGLFAPWAEYLLSLAKPASNCLDIGCGTGVVSRALARHPNTGSVSAIDIAPPMITKAKAVARDHGLQDDIAFQLASADDLPFEAGHFDTVTCQQALQFFPDKAKAVREIARVLKPGGQFCAAVWTLAKDGNPVFAAFEQIVSRRFGEDLVPFGPFIYGDLGALSAVVEQSGLRIEHAEAHTMTNRLPDVRTFVLFDLMFLGRPGPDGGLQPVIDPSDSSRDAEIDALIADLEHEIMEFIQDDGRVAAPMTANVVIAQRPA